MEIKLKQGKLENYDSELAVAWLFENNPPGSSSRSLDKILNNKISRHIKDERFEGKEGEAMVVDTEEIKVPWRLVLVVGLGQAKKFNLETMRRAAATAIKKAATLRVKKVSCVLPETRLPFDKIVQAAAEGVELGDYKFLKFKGEEAKKKINQVESFTILESSAAKVRQGAKGLEKGLIYAKATIFARDLVNDPAGETTPKTLAQLAKIMAKNNSCLEVGIFGRAELIKMKAHALLAVARGSDEEPYLVHFVYKPRLTKVNQGKSGLSKGLKKVVIVGKGLTFDAGGLSLKPSNSMTTMKSDMSGAATVLGVFSVLEKLKSDTEIHGVIPLCENMPSGKAVRPGDVVKSMSGKTIEILNTDAEGRVVLADALTYALEQKPDAIVDIATLTGACIVALGENVAGLMANDPSLARKISAAAQTAGEQVWELPLVPEYKEFIKSQVADLSNIHSVRWAGAIFGGLFLQEFVGETPWAHLDIAGPSFAEQDIIPYMPKGGTGFGVRTILEFLENL